MTIYDSIQELLIWISTYLNPLLEGYTDVFWAFIFIVWANCVVSRWTATKTYEYLSAGVFLFLLWLASMQYNEILLKLNDHPLKPWDDIQFGILAGLLFLVYPLDMRAKLIWMFIAIALYTPFAAIVKVAPEDGGDIWHLAIIALVHFTLIGIFTSGTWWKKVTRASLPLTLFIVSVAILSQQIFNA